MTVNAQRGSRRKNVVLALLFAPSLGCATDRRVDDEEPREANRPEQVIVDFGEQRQRITGFGASSAWTAPTMSAEMADRFFSAEKGLGLSLLRIQVKPNGESYELETAQLAMERGASVWAAPWSPPGEWKSNGKPTSGGALLPEHYEDWANSLADFAERMDGAGLPLLALSAQNEPDYAAEWDSCEWTPEELASFIGDYLAPALDARGLETAVLGPETANWGTFARYADAILEHKGARAAVDAVATHAYSGSAFAYATPAQHGKEIWETEMSDPGSAEGPAMDSALRVGRIIYDHLTVAEANAWHYWWLVPRLDSQTESTAALLDLKLEVTRRGYALGHYSKFVRPGFVRVATTDTRANGTFASAFFDPKSGRFALVAINERRSSVEQTFEFRGERPKALTPWLTTEEAALEAQREVELDGATLTVELEPRSIVTFVGELVGAAPADAADAGAVNAADAG